MKTQERYVIGPTLRAKLRQMVNAFDGTPIGGGSGNIPVRLQDMPRRVVGGVLHLCKTTATFSKNTLGTVEVWEDCDPPNEAVSKNTDGTRKTMANVVNKYATISADRFVSIALHGNGHWYVVAAECG